jgi:hypothetical protein
LGWWGTEVSLSVYLMKDSGAGVLPSLTPKIQNLPIGNYDIYVNAEHSASKTVDRTSGALEFDIQVSGREMGLIVRKARVLQ